MNCTDSMHERMYACSECESVYRFIDLFGCWVSCVRIRNRNATNCDFQMIYWCVREASAYVHVPNGRISFSTLAKHQPAECRVKLRSHLGRCVAHDGKYRQQPLITYQFPDKSSNKYKLETRELEPAHAACPRWMLISKFLESSSCHLCSSCSDCDSYQKRLSKANCTAIN